MLLRALIFIALVLWPMASVAAPQQSFSDFVKSFEREAVAAGISREFYRRITNGLSPDPTIKVAQATQPEFERPIWDYIDKRVSAAKIRQGQEKYRANKAVFDRVAAQIGVDPYVLAAIWGIETNYGTIMDQDIYFKPVVRSLFSLVHQRRGRVEADKQELLLVLKLMQAGKMPMDQKGSWAGAMGHLQIMPTAYAQLAVDFDRDGRIDVHNSLADALASSARWLLALGYVPGEDWGMEVSLPKGFDYQLAGRDQMRTVRFFAERGVRRVAGRQFGDLDQPVFLYVPAGHNGPKFLMGRNYLAFKGYNFADSYALTVAHLTDRLKGVGPFEQDWPRNTAFLNRDQRVALQQKLKQLGYYKANVDGRFGPISQKALRAWQADAGLVVDGFATKQVFDVLMAQ
ncbi:lytic murein transglycosylase [Maritalea mediterranea]|uniref:Lytic murein transglycosylase n=1 Tax=Maritalea mediterranea TaxID=2909667 RepID=A0ABS9EDR7_9HYPH|nr:lytic murein transglycosylase [Maritalea mediterranea]MCF4099586.1 lytic murein transglycosylase [Maritalea mediterranea]